MANEAENHGHGGLHLEGFHLQKTEFWSGDLGLTLVSISLILFIFLILPLHRSGLPGRFLLDLVMTALMVSAALAAGRSRPGTWAAIVAIVLGTAALWTGILYPTPFFQRTSSLLVMLADLIYARIVLLVMFRQGPVTWSRIQGGGCAYLLLGMAWAGAYQFLEQIHPGAVHFATQPVDVSDLTAKMAYFSFCTLTTVGYGDITPVHPFARSLAIAESVTGQLFPAVMIGALVAMAMQGARRAT